MMDYHDICEKIMACDAQIKDVYMISNEARLMALSGSGEMDKVSEAQFAEILEDLLFMISSRRHHENVFGKLEYIHIKHKNAESIAFPFEKDKVICVCMKGHSFDEREMVRKIKYGIVSLYNYTLA
jgi:hypothetical protein